MPIVLLAECFEQRGGGAHVLAVVVDVSLGDLAVPLGLVLSLLHAEGSTCGGQRVRFAREREGQCA
jgi:hypothetical protein